MKEYMDMTPICDKCGKVAPINEKMSTPDWLVYETGKPCECGGQYTPRFLLEDD